MNAAYARERAMNMAFMYREWAMWFYGRPPRSFFREWARWQMLAGMSWADNYAKAMGWKR